MFTDSERFAFDTRRHHAFATTGNAYDASQCDESIKTGDTLIVLPERVIAVLQLLKVDDITLQFERTIESDLPSADKQSAQALKRSMRPLPTPVCLPFSQATSPFTITIEIPAGSCLGCS